MTAADGSPAANEASWPAAGAGSPMTFTVTPAPGPDLTPPTLGHTPVAGPVPEGLTVTIAATITDAHSGIAAATLHWRRAGGDWLDVPMVAGDLPDQWVAQIAADDVTTGDLEYWLEATDAADPPNTARAPAEDAYSFRVEAEETDPGGGGGGGSDCAAGGEGPPLAPWLLALALLVLVRRRSHRRELLG